MNFKSKRFILGLAVIGTLIMLFFGYQWRFSSSLTPMQSIPVVEGPAPHPKQRTQQETLEDGTLLEGQNLARKK